MKFVVGLNIVHHIIVSSQYCRMPGWLLWRSPTLLPWAEPPRGLSTALALSWLKAEAGPEKENLATRLVGTCCHHCEGTHCSRLTGHGVNIRAGVCFSAEAERNSCRDFLTDGQTHTQLSQNMRHAQARFLRWNRNRDTNAPVRSVLSGSVAKLQNNNNEESQQVKVDDCERPHNPKAEQTVHQVELEEKAFFCENGVNTELNNCRNMLKKLKLSW